MSDSFDDGRQALSAISDALLLDRLRGGDPLSFETLFARYYARVYAVLFRLVGSADEAEDLTQEVFLRLYRQPLAAGREHNLGAWLYQVAVHLGYNALRSQSRRERYQGAAAEGSAGTTDQAEAALERSEVRVALAALKPQQAQLLVLRHSGLSYAEIAVVLGVAPGSVGTLLSRAERAFRDAYLRRK